jgi:hypothetical protein
VKLKKRKFFDTELREINFGSSNHVLDNIEDIYQEEASNRQEVIQNSDVGGNGGNQFMVVQNEASESSHQRIG